MKIEILGQCKSLIEQTSLPQDLGFGRFFSPVMIECHFRQGEWQMPRLKPYAPLQLDPATMVFHYGQSIFEGLKAYRSGSNLHLFRPWDHARRFIKSGQRLAMPALPEDMFMEALVEFCRMSAPLVPEDDQSTLYLRPFMFADQVGLGVPGGLTVTVPRGAGAWLATSAERTDPLVAPLESGQVVGTLRVHTAGGDEVRRVPLEVLEPVPLAGVFGRAWDALRLWIR